MRLQPFAAGNDTPQGRASTALSAASAAAAAAAAAWPAGLHGDQQQQHHQHGDSGPYARAQSPSLSSIADDYTPAAAAAAAPLAQQQLLQLQHAREVVSYSQPALAMGATASAQQQLHLQPPSARMPFLSSPGPISGVGGNSNGGAVKPPPQPPTPRHGSTAWPAGGVGGSEGASPLPDVPASPPLPPRKTGSASSSGGNGSRGVANGSGNGEGCASPQHQQAQLRQYQQPQLTPGQLRARMLSEEVERRQAAAATMSANANLTRHQHQAGSGDAYNAAGAYLQSPGVGNGATGGGTSSGHQGRGGVVEGDEDASFLAMAADVLQRQRSSLRLGPGAAAAPDPNCPR